MNYFYVPQPTPASNEIPDVTLLSITLKKHTSWNNMDDCVCNMPREIVRKKNSHQTCT